jgi:transcriptional regulator with GAF, ATPase, and Fis domain
MDSVKNIRAQSGRAFNAQALSRELMASLGKISSRNIFLQTLARLFRQQFNYDRLCINLYDPNSELLSYFTAAEGAVVNSLSPIRKAEKTTVAGHVIASRKPVVITDITDHFAESSLHPMAEAGLTTTMAFPLVLNDKIIGTLHCSFRQKPANLYEIMEFLLELAPYVAAGLGALLAMEHLEQGASLNLHGRFRRMRDVFLRESGHAPFHDQGARRVRHGHSLAHSGRDGNGKVAFGALYTQPQPAQEDAVREGQLPGHGLDAL